MDAAVAIDVIFGSYRVLHFVFLCLLSVALLLILVAFVGWPCCYSEGPEYLENVMHSLYLKYSWTPKIAEYVR